MQHQYIYQDRERQREREYECVWECVCVCSREREREGKAKYEEYIWLVEHWNWNNILKLVVSLFPNRKVILHSEDLHIVQESMED